MKMFTTVYFFILFFSAALYGRDDFRVMFYNVENLFDTQDEPRKDDDEFLPEGNRHWNEWRYYKKLTAIAAVISAAGKAWTTPALVGLCEVENDRVMTDLTGHPLLRKRRYRYIITDSPDIRGIDVALMYRPDKFGYIGHTSYSVRFPGNSAKETRDILHVTGVVGAGDTLDVFVCHFPSRRRGKLNSEFGRIHVASVIRDQVERLQRIRKDARIIIMGDFNDEPQDRSLRKTLGAGPVGAVVERDSLYNLFYRHVGGELGSYKHGKKWNVLDQLIVSGSLFDVRRFHVLRGSEQIFVRDFMLTGDRSAGRVRPNKTFFGFKYEGGYSDHLPIVVDFAVGK
ncbi:MAG: endonuclease [Dysgonamonadaceae bacterium]|jgi:predicted extracellular nuclease|nr:endonuclease [Dysgonamonadaceae bacterium]